MSRVIMCCLRGQTKVTINQLVLKEKIFEFSLREPKIANRPEASNRRPTLDLAFLKEIKPTTIAKRPKRPTPSIESRFASTLSLLPQATAARRRRVGLRTKPPASGRRKRDGGRPASARARPPLLPPLLRRIQTRRARGRSGRAAPPRGQLLPCFLLPCVARAF